MTRFNPLDYPISLSRPERIAPSTWVKHTPFAMFLVDILRPSIIVELGTQYGVSYCAFCQAVKALDLDTRCYAVDTWQGDIHAGEYGDEVLNNLKNYHDPLYSAFSHLIQSNFNDALKDFEDRTIDLLHIDGLHTYNDVKNDFINWLPKMSDGGIILFHDISVKDKDFGVWKLWKELKPQFPHIEFSYGYGLGVLVVGKKYPAALERILEDPIYQTTFKEFFFHMGLRAERESKLREKEWELELILNSNSWKFVSMLQRLRLCILPINSKREKIIKFLFRGIKSVDNNI